MTNKDFNMITNELINNQIKEQVINKTKKIMWSAIEYKELQMAYSCAMKEVQTKLEILSMEFKIRNKRNPINSITSRLKRMESVIKKLLKKEIAITLDSIEKEINDMAGIRVICSYIDDIYLIANALIKQDDIELIEMKDYIKKPKDNGYRSLHLIIKIPIFLSDEKKMMKVEVQIRTIAMDFWANLEHQLRYKKETINKAEINNQLLECANVIADTDEKMLSLRNEIEQAEDIQSEEEVLMERLKKLDIPFD